ncbi:MAG: hypothetical protein Fur0041_16020 [Bacteroidia bacterium]
MTLLLSCGNDDVTAHHVTGESLQHDSLKPAVTCDVLNRRIPADTSEEQLRKDLAELVNCGIDSFDFVYVVPNLLPGFSGEEHIKGNDSITYKDFVAHLKEFQATEAYHQLKIQVNTLDSLKTIPYDYRNLQSMKPVLGRLGMTEPEWNMFTGFARTYPVPKNEVFTWGDLLNAFESYSSDYQNQKR